MGNETPRAPRDEKGRFLPLDCNKCGNGKLRYEGEGHWRCDGLDDPGHDDLPLEACIQYHHDGEPAVSL